MTGHPDILHPGIRIKTGFGKHYAYPEHPSPQSDSEGMKNKFEIMVEK